MLSYDLILQQDVVLLYFRLLCISSGKRWGRGVYYSIASLDVDGFCVLGSVPIRKVDRRRMVR